MFQKLLVRLIPLGFLLITVGCKDSGDRAAQVAETTAPVIYGAYTMYAPGNNNAGTNLYARVVVDGVAAACPDFVGSQQTVTTTARINPESAQFPVTVCEAQIPSGQAFNVSGSAINIAAVNENPSRLLVYGDTGCKHSDCNPGDKAKPFYELADAGAGNPPDLILHMGDFNYRGTRGHVKFNGQDIDVYDAGDNAPSDPDCQLTSPYISQNASDSPSPDNWTYWSEDFFQPAASLLPLAPWVFARGNHELCSRAGPGWFYFLGPGSNMAGVGISQMSCPDQGSLSNPGSQVMTYLQFVQPYQVSLSSINVWVLDSANACDGFAPAATTATYEKQFEQVTASSTRTWIMTHRPIWGVYDTDETAANVTMQTALSQTSNGALPAGVSLSLSGHMHQYESLTFPPGRPPQVVIGNSGVALASHEAQGDYCTTVDGQQANGNAIGQYGYLDLTLGTTAGWSGSVINTSSTVANCSSDNLPQPICTLVSNTAGGQPCSNDGP